MNPQEIEELHINLVKSWDRPEIFRDYLNSAFEKVEKEAYENGQENCKKWHVAIDNGLSPENIIEKARKEERSSFIKKVREMENPYTYTSTEGASGWNTAKDKFLTLLEDKE